MSGIPLTSTLARSQEFGRWADLTRSSRQSSCLLLHLFDSSARPLAHSSCSSPLTVLIQSRQETPRSVWTRSPGIACATLQASCAMKTAANPQGRSRVLDRSLMRFNGTIDPLTVKHLEQVSIDSASQSGPFARLARLHQRPVHPQECEHPPHGEGPKLFPRTRPPEPERHPPRLPVDLASVG